MTSIGFDYRAPPIGSAREWQRRLQLEEQAEREAALQAQQAEAAERGQKRAAELAALRRKWDEQVAQYQWFTEQLNEVLERMLDLGEGIANYGQTNPTANREFLEINLPPLDKPAPYSAGFTSAQHMVHQRHAVRAKKQRGPA